MSDLIKRSDAIKALYKYDFVTKSFIEREIKAIPSADRPSEIIYGNEHNCIMTIFGECSYAETGCGDCAVVEKVRKALSADRPQGEWIDEADKYDASFGIHDYRCSNCNSYADEYIGGHEWYTAGKPNYCPNCGAKMKGADDE